ncbi:MAG: AAA domain-containing protein [Aquihabitans sp.]
MRQLGLRVGTVHGFQGAERDVMLLALGLGPDDPGGRLAFVENRNLFNVMVTRARNRAIVVTTAAPKRDGLLARFLAHADRVPSPVADLGCDDAWTDALAGELARAGIGTRAGYALGPWTLELVLDDPDEAIVFETRVAGADPDLHLARHQALAGLGWRFVEAYPTRWDHDVARAALDLPALIAAARRRTLPHPPRRSPAAPSHDQRPRLDSNQRPSD